MRSCFLYVAFLGLFLCTNNIPALCQQNTTDRLALLSFKEAIDQDPFHILSSWNDSVHYCAWPGVSCSGRHPQRVVALSLNSQGLVGSLSPHIGNLSFLRYVDLQNNSLHGHIPQEIGHLLRLQILVLSNNSFGGGIPTNLSGCRNLEVLNLIDNKMVGSIPEELGSLIKLTSLGLARNRLTGIIPASLGNLSSMYQFFAAENGLQGQIPKDLLQLWTLRGLSLYDNHLTGEIPSGLYNISSIRGIDVGNNRLNGSIPSDIGLTLPSLRYLSISYNGFIGLIPPTLSNASTFQTIDFGYNYLRGPIPKDLGRLQQLKHLSFTNNQLEEDGLSFIDSLTNCSRLDLSGNQLRGAIPIWVEYLSGLQRLACHMNNLSGSIPPSIGNLAMLTHLEMSFNNLDGRIPASLGSCRSLGYLGLSHNNLNGSIPKELLSLRSLSIGLKLSSNRLTGPLPPEIGFLQNLYSLDVSENKLNGSIPDSIAGCLVMEELHLGGNNFAGEIPQGLSALRGLRILDISGNNLSGQIPDFLSRITGLTLLNLSMNRLQGEVPERGIFLNASAAFVIGNNDLCGGISKLKLPPCLNSKKNNHSLHFIWKISIPIVVAVVLMLLVVFSILCYRRKFSKKGGISLPSFKDQILRISYAELFKSTDGFSMNNIIGLGSYGSVYKGTLSDQGRTKVAVKVLNLSQRGASRSFILECRSLGSIRHRNLLKLVSACSSVDFQGNDFKALIYEFMANGSLEKWIHGGNVQLTMRQRLDIAIDIACAIVYLHSGSPATIIHGDLKPSNVLLDDDMVAHVGDFGLAKIVSTISSGDNSSMAIKGSIGYVAPEYGMGGIVSTEGDVYSYGIILLEMFTKKRPTDSYFKDGLNLHIFVERAMSFQVMEPVAQDILHQEANNDIYKRCLLSVLKIGIKCSMQIPTDRMKMEDVICELQKIKGVYDKERLRQERRHA
ncbi:hypothetical protein Tsubulata_024166 [Turnera subulata]|uniref:non-specific serine/threonine protein kinase n=1 Tax=Turnera subulata TaxID=218843 RepID=A0A9Q0JNJ2_9ROSI|nr:hypothetical protein Tsubulata_024166 [Turnera subulata]